jgi:multiple sugar transport system ATP-binding protein
MEAAPRMNFMAGGEAAKHGAASIGIRPEHILLNQSGQHSGTIRLAEHLGSDTFLHLDAGDLGQLVARATGEFAAEPGGAVRFSFPAERIHRFDAAGKVIRA